MHPRVHAATAPDSVAYVMAQTGEAVTYGELEARANQGAHLFRRLGLKSGDTIAILLGNDPRFLEIAWAAQRAGLIFACLSSRLTAKEADYILRDSGAQLLVTSGSLAGATDGLAGRFPDLILLSVSGAPTGFVSYETARDLEPPTPISDERAGQDMLYSSGTTGRPKGVRAVLPDPDIFAPVAHAVRGHDLFGIDTSTIYLSPAPLYHAAPLRWCMSVQRLGGTVVVMERFEAEAALSLIERHAVTHAQWVPTHFVRMLKLPVEARLSYDLKSLSVAVHAAAPCPVHVKKAMMEWWGPILWEYYGGTEGAGMCLIGPKEWDDHRGSVGRAIVGELRICGPNEDPLPPGEVGDVFFANGPDFAYHNDPEKTAESRNRHGWRTFGDVGYCDAEGYLYLTDRRSFTVISGGINIYPQEIEDVLVAHPKVLDVAVFGVPDEDLGERVIAVVDPSPGATAGDELARELWAYAREHLSRVKLPSAFYFGELPRLPTGKLAKHLLRADYADR